MSKELISEIARQGIESGDVKIELAAARAEIERLRSWVYAGWLEGYDAGFDAGNKGYDRAAAYEASKTFEALSTTPATEAAESKTELEIAETFYERVCEVAEANMLKTGRLEGSHFAAMQTVLKEMKGEVVAQPVTRATTDEANEIWAKVDAVAERSKKGDSSIDRSIRTILDKPFFPSQIKSNIGYHRTHDDSDGDSMQTLCVFVGKDGDVWVQTNHPDMAPLRFRTHFGAGQA